LATSSPATARHFATGLLGDRDFNAVGLEPFHDQDHLQQILANLKSAHLRAITKTMRRGLLAG
jgi:hypothetical protein